MTDASPETPEIAEETDSEPEAITGEPKQEQVYPRRRICVSVGDCQVDVEGPEELGLVADIVAGLWQLVNPPPPRRIGFTAGESLITELTDPATTEGDE